MNGNRYISHLGLLLTGATWLIALAACSDDASRTVEPPHANRLIRLNSGIMPVTRTSVSTFDGDTIAFAQREASNTYQQVWPAVAEPTDTRLVHDHFYPANNSPLYLRGYYPINPIAEGRSVYLGLNGQTDLMATVEQAGSLTDNFSLSDKTFLFHHLLTQVSFAIRLVGDDLPTGVRLSSVYLAGSRPDATLCLSEAAPAELPTVLFGGSPQPLAAYVEPSRYGGIRLMSDATALPLALLVEPGVPLSLNVRLYLSSDNPKEYNALPIRFDEPEGKSKAGTAYQITISINVSQKPDADMSVSITTDVTPWIDAEGSGTVE